MSNTTATLARSITWAGSKQTYFTAYLMVDRPLVDDCYRAYGYFRWADDVVDAVAQSFEERISFIRRQKELMEHLYEGERVSDLAPEEKLLADLIHNDGGINSGLQSFIRNFMAVLEFDAHRKERLITEDELTWYANTLGKAVTDCIQHFIGNGHPYADHEDRHLAATAAHITHMLRDLPEDVKEGYINIAGDDLQESSIRLEDLDNPEFRAWVKGRVNHAREYFRRGKHYLDSLEVLRCKIVGYWYCARFESVLDRIERDGFELQVEYNERHRLSSWLKFVWTTICVTLKHVRQRAMNRVNSP
ncbi:MAG: squalene/phytoene synthase family protein [Anaerolineales bacterium]|nr:squalene/phytoene synthase family protein [Anaerolineales bacterium]